MLDHLQAENGREAAVAPGQIVIGGAGIKRQFGIGRIGSADAFGGRVDPGHLPTAQGQLVRNRPVAAAQLEQPPPIRREVQPVQQAEYGGQQIIVGVVQAGVGIAVAGNLHAVHHIPLIQWPA
nr:hypothetical protein [Methylococcus capsulatus]